MRLSDASRSRQVLARASEKRLLQTRICDLVPELALDGSMPGRQVRGLYRDLARVGLTGFRPKVYLGDEWFSPEGLPAIALPFYLTHPRLCALEQERMREVEGGRPAWCRQLLRHEAGHCFDHAFAVSETKAWVKMFGDRSQPYRPEVYAPDRHSRDFVLHLPDHYAQSHPDEDFAETFAVCITPGSDWKRRYRHWPKALAKLEYVDRLIRVCARRDVPADDAPLCFEANRMRMTLGRYYERRQDESRRVAARVKRLAVATLPAQNRLK